MKQKEDRLEPLPDVDPELAGLVCRQYIMPLFDTQGGPELDITQGIPQNGIVAEIKLSDKLLEAVRGLFRQAEKLNCTALLCALPHGIAPPQFCVISPPRRSP